MEKISVVMAVYYGDQIVTFERAVNSLFEQTVLPAQIVIVKDGNVSKEINDFLESVKLNSEIDVKIIQIPQNRGLANALNIGIENAKYNLIARADSDDVNVEERFEKQIREFESNKQLTVLGGNIIEFNNGVEGLMRIVPESDKEIRHFLKYRSPFNHPSVMFKKDAVLAVNGYQNVGKLEDYDLWVRLSKEKNVEFKNIPDILVKMDVSSGLYARRSGIQYFKDYISLKSRMKEDKLISLRIYYFSITAMFINIVLPVKVRELIYKKILRKDN